MRSIWMEFTIVRFWLAITVGISLYILADYSLGLADLALNALIVSCVLAFTFSITYSFLSLTRQYVLRALFGGSIYVVLTCLGFFVAWFHSDKNQHNHFSRIADKNSFLIIRVIEPPVLKGKTVNLVGEVQQVVNTNGLSENCTGKILVNLLRDTNAVKVKYGNLLTFPAMFEVFDEPKNPGEFSYKLYQSFQNIYHRTFLTSGNWEKLTTTRSNWFFKRIYSWREHFLSVIRKFVKNENDFAVASAIMLGYRDYVNGDITRAYSSSGALHVLSVSGLHLATMFLMLNYIFSWMDGPGRMMMISKAALVIFLIWIYTCLTGLSPSVLRAAMMFSLLQIGKLIGRRVHMFNVLAGSAILLMIFDPFIITEVGFKLSYLAVLGIVYLHPKISSLLIIAAERPPQFQKFTWYQKPFVFLRYDLWWFFRYVIPDFFWQLTSVSVAAQIATAPIGLYYFHQFPILFFISNWVVIPVGNLILFSGTFMFLFSFVPLVGNLFGWVFSHLLYVLNKFIFFVDGLPFALVDSISILMIEMLLMYFVIVLIGLISERFTQGFRGKLSLTALSLLLFLVARNAYETITQPLQKELVVYHVPRQSAIALIDGKEVRYFFDEDLLRNYSSMLFHVNHHLWDRGIMSNSTHNSKNYIELPFGKLMYLGSKKIVVVDSPITKQKLEIKSKINADVVVIAHNPKLDIQTLANVLGFQKIVFDSSNKIWRVNRWKQDCNKLGIQFWDVNDQGAYIDS